MGGNTKEGGRIRQRLVVCLDGTWNTRDSGTNVYHLANLVRDDENGVGTDGWRQRVYYDAGVGTGLLDGVSGGAFGIGLSKNVREAYDWLVEHHEEGDEIYVFGFSRGAFTARSLVGLIGKCGLLRRGAPLPPDEIWKGYQILGRHGNAVFDTAPEKSLRERLFGRTKRPFRPLWTLRRDKWEPKQGKPEETCNRAERLLAEWSRRVPIRCVGVFDTVGSMGVDALAIPWLRDHVAQFHDTHLTSLIEYAYHALALDEHRANFAHIPWHAAPGTKRTPLGGQVEQCWFAGAHSNVGGGYAHDPLARYALAWMIGKLTALGLRFRDSDAAAQAEFSAEQCVPLRQQRRRGGDPRNDGPTLRDSYAEIAGGLWRHVVRSKRAYRRLAPPVTQIDGRPAQSANEVVHPSVHALLAADTGRPRYDPPNLWAHEKARGAISAPPPEHRYLDDVGSALFLAGWLAAIGYAGWWCGVRLNAHGGWLAALALLALAIDWGESACNHRVALRPDGPGAEARRVVLEALLYVRLLLLLAAVAGVGLAAWEAGRALLAWFHDGPPTERTAWLAVLDALLLTLGGSFAWSGAPMRAAGLGSIVPLQRARKPEEVAQCLRSWTRGASDADARGVLMPVVRSLWRDMLSLIPTYSLLFLCGCWIALSLVVGHAPEDVWLGLLVSSGPWWRVAVGLVLACALTDYAEDALELRFVASHPTPPGSGAARLAWTLSQLKLVLLLVAGAATAYAFGMLLWLEGATFCAEQGLVRGAVLGLSLGLALVAFLERWGDRKRGASSGR